MGSEMCIRDRSLAVFFGSIVAWVTDHLPQGDWLTNVPCRRSPGRRRCRGEIVAELDHASGHIVWHCPLCGDNGLIHGGRTRRGIVSKTRAGRRPAPRERRHTDPPLGFIVSVSEPRELGQHHLALLWQTATTHNARQERALGFSMLLASVPRQSQRHKRIYVLQWVMFDLGSTSSKSRRSE